MRKALSIAGSDSSGGAGIQADLKTMTLNGVFGMSAITALTAQNTLGVTDVMNVTPEFLEAQLDAVFQDIKPDAVKIGMVASPDLVEIIADSLQKYKAKNIVVDPVMVATSGAELSANDAIQKMIERLFPKAAVITPNIPEAEVLSGNTINSEYDMVASAKKMYETFGCPVLLKGGHRRHDANDLLYGADGPVWYRVKRVPNPNAHGTGCTLSSAIASNLAKGDELEEAIRRAKQYITDALAAQLDLGRGRGPLNHAFALPEQYKH